MKIAQFLILACFSVFFGAASVFAATCSDDAKFCNDTQICTDARSYGQGKFIWQTRTKYRKHVTESKQSGLFYGIDDDNSQLDTAAFDTLREQLDKANAKLATTKQKLAAAIEKEVDLNAKLMTSLLAQNGTETKNSAAQDGLKADPNLLQAEINTPQTRLEALTAESTGYQSALIEAAQSIAELRAELAKTRKAAAQAQAALQQDADGLKKRLAAALTQKLADKAEQDDVRAKLAAALAAKLAAEQTNEDQMTEAETRTALLSEARKTLSKEKAVSANARRQMALLSQQVAALRTQLQNLQGLLDDAMAKDVAEEVQLQNLGSQLNSALARASAQARKLRKLEEAERKRLERETLVRINELETNSGDAPIEAEDIRQTVDLDSTDFELSDEQKIGLQANLQKLGFYNGAIDGDIGPASTLAIKSWQENKTYTATGELTVGQRAELLLGEEITTSANNTEELAAEVGVETAEPPPEIGQSITSVMVQITSPAFDVYNCAFNLEFTNYETGKSFDVVMYAENGDGKFATATKDIKKALSANGLGTSDNDWSKLTVNVKKFASNTACQPANKTSYSITEDGAEGTFSINRDGQLTITGLPIVAASDSGTLEMIEPVFSHSITSVIAHVANPDFDVSNCGFNLKFSNRLSKTSFVTGMSPVSGKFIATENDIEDGLVDAGLTAENNDWSQLDIQVEKFDYPFVSCEPANQNFYSIKEEVTANTFKIDSYGQLTLRNLQLKATYPNTAPNEKINHDTMAKTLGPKVPDSENDSFIWYEHSKKTKLSYAKVAKNNFTTLGISNVEVFQISQVGSEYAIAFGPFESEASMKSWIKALTKRGLSIQYENEKVRSNLDYFIKEE